MQPCQKRTELLLYKMRLATATKARAKKYHDITFTGINHYGMNACKPAFRICILHPALEAMNRRSNN